MSTTNPKPQTRPSPRPAPKQPSTSSATNKSGSAANRSAGGKSSAPDGKLTGDKGGGGGEFSAKESGQKIGGGSGGRMGKLEEVRVPAGVRELLTSRNGVLECSRHPGYALKYFCRRKLCGFGLLCEVCEEQDHVGLRHHMIDGVGIDNLVEVDEFMQKVVDTGLHYEEQEQLFSNPSVQDAKIIENYRAKLMKFLEQSTKSLGQAIDSLHKEVLEKIDLRFKKLRVTLLDELVSVVESEVKPLDYISYTLENIRKKTNVAVERLISSMEESKYLVSKDSLSSHKAITTPAQPQPKGTQKPPTLLPTSINKETATLGLQSFLESSYNPVDVQCMSDFRRCVQYIEGVEGVSVECRVEEFTKEATEQILVELEQKFALLTGFSRVRDEKGLEALLTATKRYPDNLGPFVSRSDLEGSGIPLQDQPQISELDQTSRSSVKVVENRVPLAAPTPISSICKLSDTYIVTAFQDGTVRMYPEQEVADKVYTQVTTPTCVYESPNTIHETSINYSVGYYRAADKANIYCSSDLSGKICFSVLTPDNRIELSYKIPNAHFGEIQKLMPLAKSPFVASFAAREPVKIWNTLDKYLSLIVNQYKLSLDVDSCLCDDSRYICLLSDQASIEMHALEYNNNAKNVFAAPEKSLKKKVLDGKYNSNTVLALECSNRIELPYLSVLVVAAEAIGAEVHIFQFQTLTKMMSLTLGLPADIKDGLSAAQYQLIGTKNVSEQNKYDSLDEYYQNVRLCIYQPLKREYLRIPIYTNEPLKKFAAPTADRFTRVGGLAGKIINYMDLKGGPYPHRLYLTDTQSRALCVYGQEQYVPSTHHHLLRAELTELARASDVAGTQNGSDNNSQIVPESSGKSSGSKPASRSSRPPVTNSKASSKLAGASASGGGGSANQST